MFHAEIEATSRCNTRCLHCPHEAITRPGGRMNWECFETVSGKIREHARGEPFSLSFSGMGEPLLNPLIFRFIRHVSSQALTSFATNGSALTEENVRQLMEAGLDRVYVSFNGDEPEVFGRMMGGISFDRVLTNVRQAVRLSAGSRLTIAANISVAKANRDRITRIKRLLNEEGIDDISFSLCHNRGGNLLDAEVCDTPAMGSQPWRCDVMEHTLFVDWQGRAHICDHDLHGEYVLGDLMAEPLAAVLERREAILAGGCALPICRQCTDIMKVGRTFPLDSRAGGSFRDWVYYLYQDMADPLENTNEAMRWICRIAAKDRRADRLVNRMVALERTAWRELVKATERCSALEADNAALRADLAGVQRKLDDRDREFRVLHGEFVAMRRSRAWRLARALGNDLARARRLLATLFLG